MTAKNMVVRPGEISEHILDSARIEVAATNVGPRLGVWAGISTIAGLMVGSGIFSSPGIIQQFVGSSGMALTIWILTGLLALTGALCYAELGTMIPGSGGEAQYLEKGLGAWSTFIFNWTSIAILKPGTVAILAVATATHLVMLYLNIFEPNSAAAYEADIISYYPWSIKLVAIGCCIVVTMCASISTKWSDRVQGILTMGKILAMSFVIALSLYFVCLVDWHVAYDNLHDPFTGTSTKVSDYASALNLGLWGFEGWNNLNIIAGDLINPHRTLPLSIWISVVGVVVLYLLTILGYLAVLPAEIIKSSETIGVEFGRAVIGVAGSIIMPLFISASTFGSALSSMSTSSEIIILAAQKGQIPRFFANKNQFSGTAVNAYLMQCILASCMVTISGFRDLVYLYTFPQWIFYAACALVLLKLRWQEPLLERPYKVFLSTPILFLIACFVFMGTSFVANPKPCGAGLLVVVLGLPIYFLFTKITSRIARTPTTTTALITNPDMQQVSTASSLSK